MRYIFLFLVFFINLKALDLDKYMIPSFLIAKENKTFYPLKNYNLKNEYFQNFTIKLRLNKEELKHNTYYARITCDYDKIIYTNIDYKINHEKLILKLDKDSPDEIIFRFNYKKEKPLNFRTFVVNDFEYDYFLKNDNILYGVSYGIMFSAFLYNLAIYLYNREKSFIYYSLMQLSLLIILVNLGLYTFKTFLTDNEQMFIDIMEDISVILIILFSKEILNTKVKMKLMNKVLNLFIVINIIDIIGIFIYKISILYKYLPWIVVLFIILFAGILSISRGQKVAIFYCIGWISLILTLILAEYKFILFNPNYIIHIGFPLESLILSFALAYKLKQTINEKNEKEKMLVHQSKLASMGEMINNIAHQWRQPLTHLSFINMDLQMAKEQNQLTKDYLYNKLDESNNQIEFMSDTIENFRNFYKPKKEKEFFHVSKAVEKAIEIIKPSLDASNIILEFNILKDKELCSFENNYSQVVLNLLTNAKDALKERKIQNPRIEVTLDLKDDKTLLRVWDNAKGIESKYLEKIFEPYFTTKDKSSGIGLYMSKIIVESHLRGNIKVQNILNGVCFSIEV